MGHPPSVPVQSRSLGDIEQYRIPDGGVMTAQKFPKRRRDGSFCVEVIAKTNIATASSLAERVNTWVARWIQKNRYWNWELAKFERKPPLDFFEDFVAPPECSVASADSIRLRLECRPAAKKLWRDWLVLRFLHDLLPAFQEITSVEKIRDCSEM